MWYKSLGLILLVVAQIGQANVVDASLLDIRIDFASVVPQPANWNVIANPLSTSTVHDLIDFNSGGAAGVTLQFTDGINGSSTDQTTVTAWSNPAAPWVDATVLRDYCVSIGTNSTGRLVLSGLDADKTYSMEVLSVRNGSGGSTRFEVNGTLDDAGDTVWSAYDDGWQSNGFLKWSEVTPTNVANAQGEIILEMTVSEGFGFLNGMRIAEVAEAPEPSTWVLLAMAAVGSLVARRRWPR